MVPADSLFGRLLNSLIYVAHNKGVIVQRLKSHKNSLSFAMLMLLIAWKRRRRVANASAAAIRLVLAPVREVVEAIIKPP
jgi:hypothetical protein